MQGSGSTAVPGSLLLAAGLWPTYQYRLFPGQLLEASLLPGDEEAGITRRSWGLTPSSSWPNRDGGNFIHNIQKQGPGWIQNDYVGTTIITHFISKHLTAVSEDVSPIVLKMRLEFSLGRAGDYKGRGQLLK